MHVHEAVAARRSVRDFLPNPVPLDLLRRLLSEAARAPSGSNLQPWRIHVFTGQARERLVAAAQATLVAAPFGGPPDHTIHPVTMTAAEEARYKRAAQLVYGAAGIDRSDRIARARHVARSWQFFGAPVGLIFTVERRLQPSQWADIGMYMQSLMLLAQEAGLSTCAQESWALMGHVVREVLDLDADHLVYSGLAIGYQRVDAPINQFRSERAPLEEFATIYPE